MARFDENVKFTGAVDLSTANVKGFSRTNLDEDSEAKFGIPFTHWRIHDAIHSNLPTVGAGDDLGLAGNTVGTNSMFLTTNDLKTVGATQQYARASFTLPHKYVAGGTVKVRLSVGMGTTVADNSATCDVNVYKSDNELGVGSDLVTTAATDCNSLTFSTKDFDVTSTGFVAGDTLDVRISLTVNDSASGTAVIGRIGAVWMLLDVN